MSSLVTLAELEAQARLMVSDPSEDALLQQLIDAAEASCRLLIDHADDAPALTEAQTNVLKQAILVWATAMYDDRAGAEEPPAAVIALLRPLRSVAR